MLKKRLSNKSKWLIALILSAAFASFSSEQMDNVLKRIENRSIDYRFLIRGSQPIEDVPIVIVFIDNESAMQHGYRSPTPRKLVADLVHHLNAKGAKVIGLDILLDQSYNSEEDAVLEQALAGAGKKVVLVTELLTGQPASSQGKSPGILDRFKDLSEQGFSKSKSEADDCHRWVNIAAYENQEPFALKIFQIYTGGPAQLPERLGISPESPWLLLDFPGEPSRLSDEHPKFPVISAAEVAYIPEVLFRDKIVLVGSGIEDLGDTFLTPFSTEGNKYRTIFGVELHAITLKMLLKNKFIFHLSPVQKFLSLGGLFFMTASAFLFLRPILALSFLPICMIGWFGASVYGFNAHALLLPVAYPLMGLILLFIICLWLIYSTELKFSKFLKSTFQHYIAPEMVERMVNQEEAVALGGQKAELTVFFSDLKDFTSISEMLEAEALMDFLHLYFEEMTQILFQEKGTLDKYIGDAIMAFFGAPSPLPMHAVHACRAALLMQQRLDQLNQNPKPGWFNVGVRIGINTDHVIVGNSGSQTRFNYTVIGDGVNLASRLEALNKLFGSRILISEFTRESIRQQSGNTDPFFTRELGRFVVKGKVLPVAVYEVMGFASDVKDKQIELKEHFESALKDFYERKFAKAQTAFARLKDEYQDTASAYLVAQSEHFLTDPPDITWRGEIILLTK